MPRTDASQATESRVLESPTDGRDRRDAAAVEVVLTEVEGEIPVSAEAGTEAGVLTRAGWVE